MLVVVVVVCGGGGLVVGRIRGIGGGVVAIGLGVREVGGALGGVEVGWVLRVRRGVGGGILDGGHRDVLRGLGLR